MTAIIMLTILTACYIVLGVTRIIHQGRIICQQIAIDNLQHALDVYRFNQLRKD